MKSLGSFAAKTTQATLTIAEPKPKPNRNKRCPYGFYHNLLTCYTLNSRAENRPEGFWPTLKAIRSCLDAFKDPELLKTVRKLYKDNNIHQTFDIAEASSKVENWFEKPTRL
jgi:hypothetical protein